MARHDVPANGRPHIACEIDQADAALTHETLAFLHRTLHNMRRSMRRAQPTPREGIEAGLDLMICAVEERLGLHAEETLRTAA